MKKRKARICACGRITLRNLCERCRTSELLRRITDQARACG